MYLANNEAAHNSNRGSETCLTGTTLILAASSSHLRGRSPPVNRSPQRRFVPTRPQSHGGLSNPSLHAATTAASEGAFRVTHETHRLHYCCTTFQNRFVLSMRIKRFSYSERLSVHSVR